MLLAAILAIGLARPAIQEPPDSRRLSLVAQSSTNRMEDIAINADETRILTHDREFAPRLWDRRSMRLVRVLSGHATQVRGVEFSPDGRWVVTAGLSEATLWDSLTGNEHGKLFVNANEFEFIDQATFSYDNEFVIVTSNFGNVYVCDHNMDVVKSAKLTSAAITDVRNAMNAPRATVADQEGNIVAFTVPDLSVLASFSIDEEVVWARIDREGKHVVATTLIERAHLFDVDTKRKLRTYDHFMGTKGDLPLTLMASLFVGKDGDQLLIAEQSGLMKLYDVASGREVGRLTGHTASVREIRQSVDGTKVATYGDDNRLKIWDAVGQKELPFTLGPGNPTAGEFSVDGSAFWLGFDDGSFRRHDTRTGGSDSEAVGTTAPTFSATVSGRWVFYQGFDNWIVDPLNQTSIKRLGWPMTNFRFSPNSEKASWKTLEAEEHEYYLCDVASGTPHMRYLNCLGAEFSHDSKHLITWHTDGNVYAWRTTDGEHEQGWLIEKDVPMQDLAVSPKEELVVTLFPDSSRVMVWNYLTGTVTYDSDIEYSSPKQCTFSNDGKFIAVAAEGGVGVWRVSDGKKLFGKTTEFVKDDVKLGFSPNDRWLAVLSNDEFLLVDLIEGSVVIEDPEFFEQEFRWSPSNLLGAYSRDYNSVKIISPLTPKKKTIFWLTEKVGSFEFLADGKRFLTTDTCDGLVFWQIVDAVGADPVRLGSFVQMLSPSEEIFLCTDKDGRYDATDPANVTGAHYVLEWPGGLETIAVDQLRDRFYEPGLFAKVIGLDPEAPRAVPPLDTLKLYPNLTVTRARSGTLRVGIEERDEGGAGVLRVWVNGKLVQSRNNPPGFFEIDPNEFDRYFLPSNLLPKGQGNLVRVAVTNKQGDLESPPVTIDVGVPDDLRPPDVRLFALFVGICDYAGTEKDLTAPATDARELEKAVRTVASRLLPDRVETTVLTAEVGKDDVTRGEILEWFEQTAAKATSSDIVVVFLSGHGVNQIAGEQDYFFLTAEADPTSIGPATATTAAISGKQLGDLLSGIPASKQVVILDTCHSGAFAREVVRERSISGDYRRAWQAIRDATGTWMLAGSAADQQSFESANVGHGMLTYSLLEAIDRASAQGLRQTEAGDLFVDVERWLEYASARVESLKNEVGVMGIQRPQVARSAGASFDIGVMRPIDRGFIGLKPPRPIVIVGQFDQDREDPLGIELKVAESLKKDDSVTIWTDVSTHPRAFHLTGSYQTVDGLVKATVYLQYFGQGRDRKTLEKFEVEGRTAEDLVATISARSLQLFKTVKIPDAPEIKTGG